VGFSQPLPTVKPLTFCAIGWIHIKGEQTAYTNYYKKMKPEEVNAWPPKFWKFHLETEQPAVSVAFTDPRRFGRVRLVDCPGESIRKHSPLVENGPDPVVDAEIFTVDFLKKKMRARHVPIKALLLDQTTISGIGNWVGDEVLFQAKMHPEQYCDDFSDEQIETLHKAIRYVCQLAVDKLGDSDEFPKDWMFHVRWGKGSKDAVSHLPSGEKLAFLTVGGRTSCYAPAIQKKTGKVVPGVKEKPLESGEDEPKPKKAARSKAKAAKEDVKEEESEEEKPRKRKKVVEEDEKPAKRGKAEAKPNARANGFSAKEKVSTKAKVGPKTEPKVEDGQRRSGRLQKSEKSGYFD
jgi:formamidopyrimidine-DNA glycosylase